MKVAISTQGDSMESLVDQRFGRAPYFMVADTESGAVEALDNGKNLNLMQGAGIQAARNVVRSGVSAVLTGHCGPKAFKALAAAGVLVYLGAAGTAREAFEEFSRGGMSPAAGPDMRGHW